MAPEATISKIAPGSGAALVDVEGCAATDEAKEAVEGKAAVEGNAAVDDAAVADEESAGKDATGNDCPAMADVSPVPPQPAKVESIAVQSITRQRGSTKRKYDLQMTIALYMALKRLIGEAREKLSKFLTQFSKQTPLQHSESEIHAGVNGVGLGVSFIAPVIEKLRRDT